MKGRSVSMSLVLTLGTVGFLQPVDAAPPNTITWQQHINSGASAGRGYSPYIQVDFDLPQEFRSGYVYRTEGANSLSLYVFKAGLSSYPPVLSSKFQQIDTRVAEQYVQGGKALRLSWRFGGRDERYSNPSVVFPEAGTGCLKRICLTAPFSTNAQISTILRSQRPLRKV